MADEFINWIDIERPEAEKATITVATTRKLGDDDPRLELLVEVEAGDDEWAKVDIMKEGEFSYEGGKGKHRYVGEWSFSRVEEDPRVGKRNTIRFAYYPTEMIVVDQPQFFRADECLVASDELIVLGDGAEEAEGTFLNPSGGKRPKQAKGVLGATYLTTPVVIRAVQPAMSNKFGKMPPPKSFMDYVQNINGLVLTVTGSKSTKPSEWIWEKRPIVIDGEGYVCNPNVEEKPDWRIWRFSSEYFGAQQGEMKKGVGWGYTWFCVLLSQSEGELEVRAELLKKVISIITDADLKTKLVRHLVQNPITDSGHFHKYTFYDYERTGEREKVSGRQVRKLHMLLDYPRYSGELYDVFSVFDIEPIARLSEIGVSKEDIFNKDKDAVYKIFQRLVDPSVHEDTGIADAIVSSIRGYLQNRPDVAMKLTRMPLPRFVEESEYAFRRALEDDIIGLLYNATEAEMQKKYKHISQMMDQAIPLFYAGLSMAVYEYLRLDVAYPRGQRMLDGILDFFERYVSRKNGSYVQKASAKTFGKLAANLAVEYYIDLKSAKKSSAKNAIKKFKSTFRLRLAPLGIYGDDADYLIDELHGHLAKADSDAAGKYIRDVYEGKETPVEHGFEGEDFIREFLIKKMTKNAERLRELKGDLWAETKLDIYHQYSLFEDYPRLTEFIYNQFNIRLDSVKHPKGFDAVLGKDEPDSQEDLKHIRFGEYIMWKCGVLHSEENKGTEYYACFLEGLLSIAGMHLLALEGGVAVLVEAAQGTVETFFNFVDRYGTTEKAYAKAVAGLDTLHNAEKTEAGMYFDTIFDVVNVGVGAAAGGLEEGGYNVPNPMPWLALDSALSEAVGKVWSTERKDVVMESLTYLDNRANRSKLEAGMVGLIQVALAHDLDNWAIGKGTEQVAAATEETYAQYQGKGEPSEEEQAEPGKEAGTMMKKKRSKSVGKWSAKSFLKKLYVDASCRASEGDYAMAKDLEKPLKDIGEVLQTLK